MRRHAYHCSSYSARLAGFKSVVRYGLPKGREACDRGRVELSRTDPIGGSSDNQFKELTQMASTPEHREALLWPPFGGERDSGHGSWLLAVPLGAESLLEDDRRLAALEPLLAGLDPVERREAIETLLAYERS